MHNTLQQLVYLVNSRYSYHHDHAFRSELTEVRFLKHQRAHGGNTLFTNYGEKQNSTRQFPPPVVCSDHPLIISLITRMRIGDAPEKWVFVVTIRIKRLTLRKKELCYYTREKSAVLLGTGFDTTFNHTDVLIFAKEERAHRYLPLRIHRPQSSQEYPLPPPWSSHSEPCSSVSFSRNSWPVYRSTVPDPQSAQQY